MGMMRREMQVESLCQRLDDILAQLRNVAAEVESMNESVAQNLEKATHALELLGNELRDAAASPCESGTGNESLDDDFIEADTLARARSELASGEFDVQG